MFNCFAHNWSNPAYPCPICSPTLVNVSFENTYTIPPTPAVSQEDLMLQLKQAIDRLNEMAQQYAAENERLRLHLDIAVEALEFYAAENTWSPDNFLVGSEKLRSDLSETKWSKFTPGARAREVLVKIRGEG